jgi:CRISPR-associated endonuclease Cas1
MTHANDTGVPMSGRSQRRCEADPTPRIVYESAPLSPDDIADDAARRADVYSHPDSEHVAVVDGFGARVIVERGHLELHDGLGEHRRVRRFAKVDAPRRVVVGIGTVGGVTFDALRWCSSVGTSIVALGRDGALLAGGPPGRNDARLLRAQALALYGPAGVAITRYLISEKIRGHARVLGLALSEHDAASTLLGLLVEIEVSDSIDEIRQREAAAANVYFAAWERTVLVSFARRDLPRIPSHWSEFNGRRSSVNRGSPRSATDPAGACLNYSYKLAEVEAALAARCMGLDPALGILHADVPGRPSFACDLMEAARPLVDAHVLGVLAGPLRKREFTEDARGVVRCLAPLTHRLAEATPSYAIALGPVVERVAGLLAASSPYEMNIPTTLTGAKHKAAARRRVDLDEASQRKPANTRGPSPVGLSPRGRRRTKPSASPPLPLRICRGCGGRLPVKSDRATARTEWCPSCLAERREEVGSALPAAARAAALRFAEETGVLPTHTAQAQAARSASMKEQRMIEAAYEAAHGTDRDPAWYGAMVQPLLAAFTLPAIAKAAGVSTSAAAKWRSGRAIPHPRHWAALAELVGAHPA